MTRRPVRLSLVLAAVLALGGLAPAPARADADLQRFLAGAAGLVILYGILDANRRGQAVPPVQHGRPPQWQPPQHGRPHTPHRPVALPARCAVEIGGRGHARQTVYGARCLQQAGIDTRRLLQACQVTLRTDRGTRVAYDGACVQGVAGRPGRGW